MGHIFDHIFKTAGTTFHGSYLPAALAPEEQFVVRGNLEENATDLKYLMDLPEKKKQKLKIIAGHNADWLRPHFPTAKYLTLVRDPIERCKSAYLYLKYHRDKRNMARCLIRERNMSLAEFVENDVFTRLAYTFLRERGFSSPGFLDNQSFARRYSAFGSMQNRQAKTLLGDGITDFDISSSAVLQERICSRFDLVGCTEQLELFLFFLHKTEGFPLVLFNNRLVRQEQFSFELQPSDLEAIKSVNKFDLAVYRFVKEYFDQRVADIWTDECEVHYRAYMKALSDFRVETAENENLSRIFEPPSQRVQRGRAEQNQSQKSRDIPENCFWRWKNLGRAVKELIAQKYYKVGRLWNYLGRRFRGSDSRPSRS